MDSGTSELTGRVTGPLIDKVLTAAFTDVQAATEEEAAADGHQR